MSKINSLWRRKLLMLLCVIMLFSTALPIAAYAESGSTIVNPDTEHDVEESPEAVIVPDDGCEENYSDRSAIIIPDGNVDTIPADVAVVIPDNGTPDEVTISSTSTTSYFETNTFTGTWRDTGTPLHLINETGYIAYCLQTSMESPSNTGYRKIHWWDMYDAKTANGVFAIITNGYPNNTGGFTEEQARYATANALRFWLGECKAPGAYDWMNLQTYPNNFRGKYGYEDLFDWCVHLLNIARAETDGIPYIELDPHTITLTKSGDDYVGSTTVNMGFCSGGYEVAMHTVPDGVTVDGITGGDGGRITVRVPSSMAGQNFTLHVDGINEDYDANIVYYAPNNSGEQHVAVYTPDPGVPHAYTSLTVNVPEEIIETANISIAKVDGDTQESLSGAVIALYDADKTLLDQQTTNADGSVFFPDLPLGNYYLQEIAAPEGYLLDDTMVEVCLKDAMSTFVTWMYNFKPKHSTITVTKVDAAGKTLSGASFLLESSSDGSTWLSVSEKTTDGTGQVSFTELDAALQHRVTETKAPPGYSLSGGVIFEGTVEGGEELYFTVCDCAIPVLPFTGSTPNFISIIPLMLCMSIFYALKRKENVNEKA